MLEGRVLNSVMGCSLPPPQPIKNTVNPKIKNSFFISLPFTLTNMINHLSTTNRMMGGESNANQIVCAEHGSTLRRGGHKEKTGWWGYGGVGLGRIIEGMPHLATMRKVRGIAVDAVGLTHSQELVPYHCPFSVLQPRRTQSIKAQNKKAPHGATLLISQGKSGGATQSRTGLNGFAIRCITALLSRHSL